MVERAKWRFDVRSSLLTLLVVALASGGYRAWKEVGSSAPPAKHAPDLEALTQLAVGTQGTLRDPMRGGVFMTRSRDDYDALSTAQNNQDQIGLREIVASGHAFRLANGNPVELRGKDPLGLIKIRILGGDHGGEEAWTSGEFFNVDMNAPAASTSTTAQANPGDGAPVGGP